MFYHTQNNYILLDNGFKAYIVNSCNGYVLYALLISILIYLKKNLKYIVISLILLFIFNLFRIEMVLFFTNIDKNLFDFFHNIVARIFMIFVFLSMVWIATKNK